MQPATHVHAFTAQPTAKRLARPAHAALHRGLGHGLGILAGFQRG